jgi:hypothetical protein
MRYLIAVLALAAGAVPSLPDLNEAVMTTHAKGTFDVKVIPQPADDQAGGPFARLFLDKQFHGDLEAASHGQMLASGTGAENSSGAYVALEHVSGTLHGRRGSFVLQHNGTMRKGVASMIVTVVPDSGTDELAGLAGKMTIIIAGGTHSYALEYSLDGSQP